MKNAVWIALMVGLVVGGISGYTIRIWVAPDSAQEELAKAELKDREQAQKNWEKTKDSVRRSLLK